MCVWEILIYLLVSFAIVWLVLKKTWGMIKGFITPTTEFRT